jgi:hypothetical protein
MKNMPSDVLVLLIAEQLYYASGIVRKFISGLFP